MNDSLATVLIGAGVVASFALGVLGGTAQGYRDGQIDAINGTINMS